MAERLKKQILEEEKIVDLVCGPDAYKDLPRMLAVTDTGQTSGILIVPCLSQKQGTLKLICPSVRLSQKL